MIDCSSATVFVVSQHMKRMFLVSKFCHREGSALEPLCLTIFIPYARGSVQAVGSFFFLSSRMIITTQARACALSRVKLYTACG